MEWMQHTKPDTISLMSCHLYEWAMSLVNRIDTWHDVFIHVTWLVCMCHTYSSTCWRIRVVGWRRSHIICMNAIESYHTYACKGVISHIWMQKSQSHIRMQRIHMTHWTRHLWQWPLSSHQGEITNESCDVFMSHVTYEYVMSKKSRHAYK